MERIHPRNVPAGMPAPDLTVGLSKVWLRPQMMETLLALQPHCNFAIWSSTTTRNTTPLVEAVFNSPRHYPAGTLPQEVTPGHHDSVVGHEKEAGTTGRSKRNAAALSPPSFGCPLKFEFVWTREHTTVDDFRRRNPVVRDDGHATVKDISKVFLSMPSIATPQNTLLIDDTPSKGKLNADNFLWLDTCEALRIKDSEGMKALRIFIEKEILGAKDVRQVLPHRVRVPPPNGQENPS